MLTSLFSLFYVTGEFHRFLHRGRAEFCQLQLFPAEIYLFFRHWNFQINATSRTHASCLSSQLAAFADIFGVREEFFCPAFIRLDLETALCRFREQCKFTWRPWILKCLEATHNWYHISPVWQVFSPGEEIVNWSDFCGGSKTRPLPLNTRQSEAVTVSLFSYNSLFIL